MSTAGALKARLQPTNQQFLDYWLSKCAGAAPPRKADIDPVEIPSTLPDLVIYERLGPAHFHVRLAGTRVVERIGCDPTGANVLDLIAYASADLAKKAMNRILDKPCAHYSVVVDRYPSGREGQVEILRLPLLSDAGQARFIISSTVETTTLGYARGDEHPSLLAQPMQHRFFVW